MLLARRYLFSFFFIIIILFFYAASSRPPRARGINLFLSLQSRPAKVVLGEIGKISALTQLQTHLAGVEKCVLPALVQKKKVNIFWCLRCFYNVLLVTWQQERLVYEHVIGGWTEVPIPGPTNCKNATTTILLSETI